MQSYGFNCRNDRLDEQHQSALCCSVVGLGTQRHRCYWHSHVTVVGLLLTQQLRKAIYSCYITHKIQGIFL